MAPTALNLLSSHSLIFVAAAAAICLVAAWLLALLIGELEAPTIPYRGLLLTSIPVVAGLGVWTTHFIAMLGYRPDVLIAFDPVTTTASAVIAICAVGLPLASAAVARSAWRRAAFGATSGLGIGAMHLTGMAAMESCTRTQSLPASLVACLFGAACLALACVLPARSRPRWLACLLITTAVCGTHFVAMAGTTVTAITAASPQSHAMLSLFTLAGAVLLLGAAALGLLLLRWLDTQAQAHANTLSTALENMSNGLISLDINGQLRIVNGRFLEIFGLDKGDVEPGMTLSDLVDAVGRVHGWNKERRALADRRVASWLTASHSEYVMDNGAVMDVRVRSVAAGGFVLTFDDVTSDRKAKQQIEELAFHDPLTGLPNRRALQDRMAEGFSPKLRFKLLLIDLDRFKVVNDTFGHGVGDQLLVQVAERVRANASHDGYVARLGGDEMAVLVYGDTEVAMAVADGIVSSIGEPFVIGETTLVIGCSIGLCCTDDASTPDELMRRSDLALYEAKRHGRGRACCYRDGLQEAIVERHQTETDMRIALQEGQFHLAYQPVLSLGDNTVVGYEALIRWDHPTRGPIPPVSFIPLAEETGQILAIGRWVLEEACREAASWAEPWHIAVNVSPVQLRSPALLVHVKDALGRSGLPANRLEIELTETALVDDGKHIAATLRALRALGIKIAMDDFGTGYSSLSHLREFPIDRIKIDRSFVAAAKEDSHAMAVLRAVTQIGRDMHIPTLAEGVETNEQVRLLRSLGCEAVQGYLIGRPERMQASEQASLRRSA